MILKNRIFLLLLAITTIPSFAQNKYINKAENAVYVGNYEKAETYYLKALDKDVANYKANRGLGILYVEYMEKEGKALPYLEKAVSSNNMKQSGNGELLFATAKCYHYLSNYAEALNYYNKMKAYDCADNTSFQPELDKRIADCEYALAYMKEHPTNKEVYIVNMGDKINTDKPEYVPVLISDDKLIFTSKRKDHKKEKLNPYNGGYYESMYVTEMKSGYPSVPQRYTIPHTQVKFKNVNDNEAVVSAITDNKIFIYSNRKLYEGDINSTSEKPFAISPVINFDDYQNHATVSKDGKTLYFTSESEKGFGGIDIYLSTKNTDGTWSIPENLGQTINTNFDEEAPFISDDGKTLFFSSKGHPGFGGFDIYKTTLENGRWSTPVNLGLPINSPSNDIFFIQNSGQINGYLTSSRDGGMGSLDIYKINYLNKLPDCSSLNVQTLVTNIKEIKNDEYTINSVIPDIYKNKILEYSCLINDSLVAESFDEINYKFNTIGTYTVKTKVIAYCDTCLNVYVACNESKIEVKTPLVIVAADLTNTHGELSAEQLASIGFDLKPLYFNLNQSSLTAEANNIVNKNIELLKKYNDLHVVIYAFTDARGSTVFNKILSLKRANAVKKHLIDQGIDKKRIDVVGKGESDLLNKCADGVECSEEEHQMNRRAEFRVIKK